MATASHDRVRANSRLVHPQQPSLTIPETTILPASIDARSPGEALNRNRQNLFAKQLKNFAKAKSRRVAVLLLSWDVVNEHSLRTAQEISELTTVFQDKYHFKVYSELLSCYKQELPHYQLQTVLSNFFAEHDKAGTLCIVYYGGHADSDKRGEELILRGGFEHRNVPEKESIYWNRVEPSLQRLNADLLLILDCCYAGIVERSTRQWNSLGHFEFIGSTTWDATARGPDSPGSFTRHLIQALQDFASENIPFFTTASLVRKIISYRNFRIGARGSICLSTCGKTNVFRHLNIMPLKPGHMQISSPVSSAPPEPLNFYLHLKYVFTKEPSERDIMTLVDRLSELIKNDGLPVSNVLWEGLSKYNPKMQMADAAERLLAVFSRRSSLSSLRRFQSQEDKPTSPPTKLSRSLTALSNELDPKSEDEDEPSRHPFSFNPKSKKLQRSLTKLSTENGIMLSKEISPPDMVSPSSFVQEPESYTEPTKLRRVPTVQFSSRRRRTLLLRSLKLLVLMVILAGAFIFGLQFTSHLLPSCENVRCGSAQHMNDHSLLSLLLITWLWTAYARSF